MQESNAERSLNYNNMARTIAPKDIGDVGMELNELGISADNQQNLIDELFKTLDSILSKNEGVCGNATKPEELLVPLAENMRNVRRTLETNNSRLRSIISSIRL
ncbi:MAG: hypothetical protein V4440_14770 [Pseudomonadota bacterium]